MKYNKDTTIGEILQDNPKKADVLLGFGMHCLGCPMSRRETMGQACAVHELDLDFVLAKLNDDDKNETNVQKMVQSKAKPKAQAKPKTKI